MPVIQHETYVDAPIRSCFDLARTVEIHAGKIAWTTQHAIDGVTTGLMESDDWVTWETKTFGIRQSLASQIVHMDKPHTFTDEMVCGIFHSFTHLHEFFRQGDGTMMKDTFSYTAPFGIVGKLADRLFLERYMSNFIYMQAIKVKVAAELNQQG